MARSRFGRLLNLDKWVWQPQKSSHESGQLLFSVEYDRVASMLENMTADMGQREWNLKFRRMDADNENLRALTTKAVHVATKALDESAKIKTENKWHPWVVLASTFGAGAALFASAVAFVKLFLS